MNYTTGRKWIQRPQLLFNEICFEIWEWWPFLTVDLLITLNNIITYSRNITLRDINVKPADDKTYMDKSLIVLALYQLVDGFNERKLTHKQFCNIF